MARKAKVKKVKDLSLKEEKKNAWSWFSLYIRLKYADKNGVISCVTCGKTGKFKGDSFHAGHLVSGRTHAILLDEDLVRPQCYTCNMVLEGQHARFVMYLKKVEKKTDEQIEELISRDKKNVKYKAFEFREFADKYKSECIKLLNEKGLSL